MVLLVALVCLASYRLTRLVVVDEFPPILAGRLAIERRLGVEHPLAYLVNCSWCTSVWIAGLLTVAADLAVAGGLVAPALVWLTASAVSGLVASVEA